MRDQLKLKYLKVALVVIGIFFIAGIYLMMVWVWPSGWSWAPKQSEYEQMIMGMYTTLGVFLVQAIVDETERANLLGDIPALFLMALVLWCLMPTRAPAS